MPYTFTPPTYELGIINKGPLLARYTFTTATSVVKRGASYESVQTPAIDLFQDPTVDFIYQGGHVYDISDDEAALLQAAGYTPVEE